MNVLVVGGGPAGAAAAITARQAGMDVTLLEVSRGPRFRPGETLPPAVEPILEQLNARAVLHPGCLRHSGTWVQWGGPFEFVPFGGDDAGSWQGFQAPRLDFDHQLLKTALTLGVEVREGTTAKGIIMRDSRVAGVVTSQGAIHAEHVIDASGGRHWLARQLGVPIIRHPIKLIARYGYVSAVNLERVPSIRADAEGWTWIADIGRGHYCWARVTTPPCALPATWLPDEFRNGRPAFSGHADVTWRIADQTAGEGWFICGDAALVLDPSSSHGVLRGLMTGIAAGRAAVDICGANGAAGNISEGYDAWVRDWFRYDVIKMSEQYSSVGLFGY